MPKTITSEIFLNLFIRFFLTLYLITDIKEWIKATAFKKILFSVQNGVRGSILAPKSTLLKVFCIWLLGVSDIVEIVIYDRH